ncbi:restriction endonuclease subunit S [Vibrio sp. 10N.261.52.C11]|uniref:restriction endonuclease subunit S n=1 Tax=Vibrio sp. 10N.261.52.C11 TaxID=3229680 RepID=UPI003551CD15
MGSNWPRVKVSDICELIVDCVNKTAPVSPVPTLYKMIRTPNIKNGRVSTDDCRCVDADTFAKWTRRATVERNDVLLTREAPLGEVGIVNSSEQLFLGQRIMQYRADETKLDPHFLLYSFLSPDLQHQFSMHEGSGSVVSHIRVGDCSKFELNLPSLDTQKRISEILRNVDKKITLNNQINQTLEKMAQTLFKSWFVDFDPVKAKMNGEQPKGMDTATASLFPEKLVESELGLIPEGWDAVQVGDIVQRLKPKKRYTKKQVEPYGKTPVYEQGASILLGFHNDDAGFDASPEDPVFIFGDHTCITHLSCSKFDISSNVIPLKGSVRPTIWTYYAIQGKQEFQEYRRHWSEFIIKDVVLPPVELAEKYAELVTTKYLMMESLKRQSKELEQLRDTLLPKLLSGEIDLESVQVEQVKELAE